MTATQTVEIDGDVVGILTCDHGTRTFHFHSGIAPYELLDGSRFVRTDEAYEALRRMKRAARTLRSVAGRQSECVQ